MRLFDPVLMAGAIHEAGHIVMFDHHENVVVCFQVLEDGTGETVPSGGPVFDYEIALDTMMGGPAAEAMYLGHDQCPDLEDVDVVLCETDLDDEYDERDDYRRAVERLTLAEPDWSPQEVTDAMRASYARCTSVLGRRWHQVEALARMGIASPGRSIQQGEIEQGLAAAPDSK
ncbi:MAG: hypothetical protein JKY61_04745 [Planctomycetes bacterium]|nr:hypothetical protein [Planctomycetota bacterium]